MQQDSRAIAPPVFDIHFACESPPEDNQQQQSAEPTLEDLAQTPAQRAAFERGVREGVQFEISAQPVAPEFIEACRKVGRQLEIPDEEIDRRLDLFTNRLVIRKSVAIPFSGYLYWDPEADPAGNNAIAQVREGLEPHLRAIIQKRRALIENFNASAAGEGVPAIKPPKARRRAGDSGAHVPIERKYEWCALRSVFKRSLAEIRQSKWNPGNHSRQAIEQVLKEFGAELGLAPLDFRTKTERVGSRKMSGPKTS
jgi:hypothetical protein